MLNQIKPMLRDLRRMANFAAVQVGQHMNQVGIRWEKKQPESWLAEAIAGPEFHIPLPADYLKIEKLADHTESLGQMPLWEGYGQTGATRDCSSVRSSAVIGSMYAWLVRKWKPAVIVEFGTAFGISGMYWLSGIKSERKGQLFTFEPNQKWAQIARNNLSAIDTRFILTEGAFEDNVDSVLKDQKIDIAFIDAIHTSDFVLSQFQLVCDRSRRPALVLFDDIDFSEDMLSCWAKVVAQPEVVNAFSVNQHMGVVEIKDLV